MEGGSGAHFGPNRGANRAYLGYPGGPGPFLPNQGADRTYLGLIEGLLGPIQGSGAHFGPIQEGLLARGYWSSSGQFRGSGSHFGPNWGAIGAYSGGPGVYSGAYSGSLGPIQIWFQ